MPIYKPQEFVKDHPKVSIVMPIFRGERSRHVARLLEEFRKQTFQDFEVIISSEVAPNGRARNDGVVHAKGEFLIFIDETIYLTQSTIFEHILDPFKFDSKVGLVGASCGPLPGINWVQRQYFKSRNFHIPEVEKPYTGARVQHACMAMPKKLYERVGGESDRLITGTDNDLRLRVSKAGFKAMMVPESHVYYEPPKSWKEILRKSFLKGRGAALAFQVYPGLFELSPKIKIRNVWMGVLYKTASLLSKFFRPFYLTNPLVLGCEIFIWLGFLLGCIQWATAKPDFLREDLRWEP